MRWTLLLMSTMVAAILWLPGQAAQPIPTATSDNIAFAQYRDWRNAYNERRRSELARQLSRDDLPAPQRARLVQVKAYYDWLIGLAEADRDKRYHERFDRIDANHDGTIDAAERAAWRDKQRAFYRAGGKRMAPPSSDGPAAALGH